MEFMYNIEPFNVNKADYSSDDVWKLDCRLCARGFDEDEFIFLRALSRTKSNIWAKSGPYYYHIICFVAKYHPENIDCIKNFESLDIDLQIRIQEKITESLRCSGKRAPPDADDENEDKKMKPNKELSPPIQELVKTLFDKDSWTQSTLDEIQIDVLEKNQTYEKYEKAFKTLGVITYHIEQGALKGKEDVLEKLSKSFYEQVPCTTTSVINTLDKVKEKRKLVESLNNIEEKFLNMKHANPYDSDPIERLYERLETDISTLDPHTEEFSIIKQYLENTSQGLGVKKLTIDLVFKIKRHGEELRNRPFAKLHNRMLLWHGSSLNNFVGILRFGLKVAPKEARHTGFRFGRGIYFADLAAKSACYSYMHANKAGTDKTKFTAFMVLCEVALGDIQDARDRSIEYGSNNELTEGKNSTKYCGNYTPSKVHVQSDGVVIPYGAPVPNNVTEAPDGISLTFNDYSEYIVFDPAQVSVKYLVKIKEL